MKKISIWVTMILILYGNVYAAPYPGSPACVRNVKGNSWAVTSDSNYNGTPYQGDLQITFDQYGGITSSQLGTRNAAHLYYYSPMPIFQSYYWNGSSWQINAGLNFAPHYLDQSQAQLLSRYGSHIDYNSYAELPAGGCANICVAPAVLNQYGRCEVPPCDPPNAINPQGNCVNCPTGIFDLAGNCMPYCGHATLETVGSIIPNTGFGYCQVPPCTAGEINTDGKCYPNCADQGKTYNKVTGLCESNCAPDTVYNETEDRCMPRCGQGEIWQEANAWTEAGCIPSTTPLPECKTINGVTGVRNAEGKCMYTPLTPLDCAEGYEPVGLDCVQRPIDCGEGKHQEGDKCIDNPKKPDEATPLPTPEETPSQTPTVTPEIPANATPEEKTAKYLENVDKNIQKQILAQETHKVLLKSIAENQAKQVDNTAKGVEEATKQSQELREQTEIAKDQASTLAGIKTEITNQTDQPVKAAIEAMGEKISDKIDEQKTDSTGPAAATFEGGFNTEQDFSEHENASEIATEKATAAKEALPSAGTSPFIVGTTITQDACIVGNFRGTEWRACFDYPWAVVAYQIMKAVLITVGYIQSIMLINRGMNGG